MTDLLEYLPPEQQARVKIDTMLAAAGWDVQHAGAVKLSAARGVAVREFVMKPPHGRVDYLLFVDGRAVGVIEAKKAGTTLAGVEWQAQKYTEGMPEDLEIPIEPLPFAYTSTGVETWFANGLDPEPRSRRVFSFHRPETFATLVDDYYKRPLEPTLRHRLRKLPQLDPTGLWPAQERAIRNLEQSLADDRPRALVQMATGSGKAYTAASLGRSRIPEREPIQEADGALGHV